MGSDLPFQPCRPPFQCSQNTRTYFCLVHDVLPGRVASPLSACQRHSSQAAFSQRPSLTFSPKVTEIPLGSHSFSRSAAHLLSSVLRPSPCVLTTGSRTGSHLLRLSVHTTVYTVQARSARATRPHPRASLSARTRNRNSEEMHRPTHLISFS